MQVSSTQSHLTINKASREYSVGVKNTSARFAVSRRMWTIFIVKGRKESDDAPDV